MGLKRLGEVEHALSVLTVLLYIWVSCTSLYAVLTSFRIVLALIQAAWQAICTFHLVFCATTVFTRARSIASATGNDGEVFLANVLPASASEVHRYKAQRSRDM